MTAKIRSIDFNGGFGTYNKRGMSRTQMREALNIDLDARPGDYVVIGNSPDDRPMFKFLYRRWALRMSRILVH
jgi:hypothetical protein